MYIVSAGNETGDQICVESGTSCIAGSTAQPVPTGPGAVRYYLADHLGTTTMELSSGGWPMYIGDFAPYGQEIIDGTVSSAPTDTSSNHYKFTGKERDAESGLDYFGARYYASSMGRWMSPDWASKAEPVPYAKLDDPQSLNLYSYVSNRPLTLVDLDGHLGIGGNDGRSADQCNANASGTACVPSPAPQQIGKDPTLPTEVDSVTVTAKPSVWKRIGSWFGGAAHGVSYAATVFIIKHSKLAMEGNKSSFEYWSKQSNEDIIKSLNPGGKEPMQVRMDGENENIINGNMRYSILQSRGADLGGLKPEVLPPVTIGPMIEPTIEPEIIP